MPTRDLITEKLREAFAPDSLTVEDESHRHEGHAGPVSYTHLPMAISSTGERVSISSITHRR